MKYVNVIQKRPSILRSLAVVSATLLVSAAQIQAAIIASDDFETPTVLGNLATQNGGSGWAAGWTVPAGSANVIDTTASPLTYSISGGATLNGGTHADQNITTATGSAQVTGSRQLSAAFSGGDIYVSFLMKYSGSAVFDNSDTFALYLSTGATTTANAFNFGPRNGNTFMVRQGTGVPVTGGATNVSGTPAYPVAQTFLAVAQLKWDGASYNRINGWLNPAQGDSGTPQVTESKTAGTGFTSISYLFFRNIDFNNDGASANDFWTVDNLVVGTSWADVVPAAVPEPSTLAVTLLGLGGLFLFRKRS
jgi:hypothetical protein